MSDTEPESEHSTQEINSFDDGAIELARCLDIAQNQGDEFNRTTELSTVIADYVDSALQNGDRDQALHVFRLLMTKQSLALFLELRCKLRLVQPMQSGFCFTWVDEILSKLGILVLSVINDDYQGDSIYHGTLKFQMEHDAVRAANCWEAFPSALNAQHLSPAAKRLILRLLFGVLIMQVELDETEAENSNYQPQVVLSALETGIKEFVQFDPSTGAPVISKGVVDCAFFLVLYTTLNKEPAAHTPYTETHLLALLDFILHSNDESNRSAAGPVLPAICFHWGKLMPWCWVVRTDHRLANTEIATTATIHWLQAIDCHGICISHKQCKLAMTYLAENPTLCFIAISDVLVHGVSQLLEYGGGHNNLLSPRLDKSCFFLSFLFRELSQESNCGSYDRLQPYISRVGWSVLQLCVIQPYPGRLVWTEYLRLLLAIDKAIIHQCLVELQRDHHLQFSSRVDHVLSETKAQFLKTEMLTPPQIFVARFTLGFLTVICNSGAQGIILRENNQSLFTRLFNHLIVGNHHIQYRETLLGPAVTALVAAEKYFKSSRPLDFLARNEGVWRLCLRDRGSTASLALAQYVIHGNYPQKWLLISETLDHFRSIILATIQQQGSQDFKRLSGIACPTFCLAVVRLLARNASVEVRAAHHFFTNSPWTKELSTELRKFLSSKTPSVWPGSYCDGTRHTLRDTVTLLIQSLADQDGSGTEVPAIEVNTKLRLYQSEVVMCVGDIGVEEQV